MDEAAIRKLLDEVREGRVGVDAAVTSLKDLPFKALADATLDTHRTLRSGTPEVVFAEGKPVPALLDIAKTMLATAGGVLCTRVDAEKGAALLAELPQGAWDASSRTFRAGAVAATKRRGTIAIVTAGTSDRPIADEAAVTAAFLGNEIARIEDVGVAGMHRLAARRGELEGASVLIVIAGMEGALASVVAGLVSRPVVAVPTSVGYGANFGGLAALLAMLSSCAPGIGVVNIDNGFGAAVLASTINRA